ncbi:type II secretion system F family protein [Candidatus Parcubacteria bacterium]|nr:MAG: type II secretion system F family protein [Candidatus Parcubacteria bacterium]
MAKFSYTAERTNGEIYQGVADVRDRFELYQVIRREGGRLLHLTDESAPRFQSMQYWNILLSRVSEQQKIMFARNLGSMITAGLSLARALSVIERQAKNPRVSQVVSQIGSDVRRGSTLHAAFAKFPKIFPAQMVAMVRAGEESGQMPGSLKLAADNLERSHDLKKKIRGAMFYPSIVFVVILGIGALMMIFVVPTLTATFSQTGAKLPLSTRTIIGISNALTQHTVLFLGAVIGIVVLIYTALKSERGTTARSWVVLRLPMIGTMAREVNAARTARSLSSLISSGVDVISALDITRDVLKNTYFQDVMEQAKKAVAQGEPLSTTFVRHEDLYPPFVGEMMSVGEETGQTAEMLKNLAVYYEDEVNRKTKDLSTIIEPLLMIFIGAAVGFFAVSMIAPIYQVTQSVS